MNRSHHDKPSTGSPAVTLSFRATRSIRGLGLAPGEPLEFTLHLEPDGRLEGLVAAALGDGGLVVKDPLPLDDVIELMGAQAAGLREAAAKLEADISPG